MLAGACCEPGRNQRRRPTRRPDDDEPDQPAEPTPIEVNITIPGAAVTIKAPGTLDQISAEARRNLAYAHELRTHHDERTGQLL